MTDQLAPLKYYFDTHIAKAVAVQLRNRGVDVVRCEEVGLAKADDIEHLEFATREGRAVVTHDEDFLSIAKKWRVEGRHHAGIMFVHPRLQGKQYIGVVIKALLTYYELIAGGAGHVESDIYDQVIYIT